MPATPPPGSPDAESPTWPEWFQKVVAPDSGVWRVRTVDLLLSPGQFAPAEARTIAENMGRYRTTIERPDGGMRSVYIDDEEEAEAYHRRTVQRIMSGQVS